MHVAGVLAPDTVARGAISGGFFMYNDQADEAWKNTPSQGYDPAGRYFTWLPYGVAALGRPSSVAAYEGRTYICGGHTYNLMIDEHHRVWKQGLRGPEIPPEISGATGTGNIAYLSWFDELTNERSPLSQGTVISTATPRTWQNLPERPPDETFSSQGTMTVGTGYIGPDTGAANSYALRPGDRISFTNLGTGSFNLVDEVGEDGAITVDNTGMAAAATSPIEVFPTPRATHLELWLSVAGGYPRLVMQVPIGTTSVAESVGAGELGESFIGAFERFPRCTMNTIYHDRQVLAGDPDNPDTIYLSDLFLPERYAGLAFKTRSGEPVTGLLGMRDYCLIFTRDRTYILQGYTTSDFSLTMLEQSLGSVGHNCNQIVHGSAYIWTEKGPYMFNGAWHPLSPENEFSQPAADFAGYIRGVVDPDTNTYIVLPFGDYNTGGDTDVTIKLLDHYTNYDVSADMRGILVFDYTTVQPEAGGSFGTARFSLDSQYVFMSATGTTEVSRSNMLYWHLSNKWGLGQMYLTHHNISETGESFRIYHAPRRNIYDYTAVSRVQTSSDLTAPDFFIVLGHYYLNDPGGHFEEGKAFQRLWFDMQNYNTTDGTLKIYPGDEDAYGQQWAWHPTAKYYIGDAEQVTWKIRTYEPDTGGLVHRMEPPMRLSGRGLTIALTIPDLGHGASFKGWGGIYVHGPASRFGTWQDPV